MKDSTALARELVALMIASGVSEVVLSPGSRNAPLSFALYDAAAQGTLRLHTRIDERTAGFLALGFTRVHARAAVVCTSGTAVANLHPAVLEAAHAGLGLLVVTADRPASMRGTGASQTTDQVRIFGDMADFHDVDHSSELGQLAESLTDLPWGHRPLHLNVQFSPPLVPGDRWRPEAPEVEVSSTARNPLSPASQLAPEFTLASGPRTVVVAGDDAGPPARVLAERAGWPLLAEPTSGSRTGTNSIRCYRLLLDTELGERIERVVVHGHPTLSRQVTRLLERADVEVVSVRARGVWAERPFAVQHSVAAVQAAEARDTGWLDEWRSADRAVSRRLDALLAAEPDLTPYEVAGAVSRALPAGGLLFVGASSPIRDLDLMVAPYPPRARRKVIANRGLAGIDGTVSSAIGAALGRPSSTRSFALMGDVTFLHDMTALVQSAREQQPDLSLVVVNDDGGSIFAMLEQGAEQYADSFEALFATPHGVDVASLCAATRTPHLRVGSLPELEQALNMPNGGLEVIEATVRRDNRRELDARIRGLC